MKTENKLNKTQELPVLVSIYTPMCNTSGIVED